MASNDVTEKILDLLNQSPDAPDALQRVLNTFSSVNITKPVKTSEDQPWGIIPSQ